MSRPPLKPFLFVGGPKHGQRNKQVAFRCIEVEGPGPRSHVYELANVGGVQVYVYQGTT